MPAAPLVQRFHTIKQVRSGNLPLSGQGNSADLITMHLRRPLVAKRREVALRRLSRSIPGPRFRSRSADYFAFILKSNVPPLAPMVARSLLSMGLENCIGMLSFAADMAGGSPGSTGVPSGFRKRLIITL